MDQDSGPRTRLRTGAIATPDRVLRSASKKSSEDPLERSLSTPKGKRSIASTETKTPKVRSLQLGEDVVSTPTRRSTRRSVAASPQTTAEPTPPRKRRTSTTKKTATPTKGKTTQHVKSEEIGPKTDEITKSCEDGYDSADSGIKEMEGPGYRGINLSPISETSPGKEGVAKQDSPLFNPVQTTPPKDKQMKQTKRKSSSNEKKSSSVEIMDVSPQNKRKRRSVEVVAAAPPVSLESSLKMESGSSSEKKKKDLNKNGGYSSPNAVENEDCSKKSVSDGKSVEKENPHDSTFILNYSSEEENEIIPSTEKEEQALTQNNEKISLDVVNVNFGTEYKKELSATTGVDHPMKSKLSSFESLPRNDNLEEVTSQSEVGDSCGNNQHIESLKSREEPLSDDMKQLHPSESCVVVLSRCSVEQVDALSGTSREIDGYNNQQEMKKTSTLEDAVKAKSQNNKDHELNEFSFQLNNTSTENISSVKEYSEDKAREEEEQTCTDSSKRSNDSAKQTKCVEDFVNKASKEVEKETYVVKSDTFKGSSIQEHVKSAEIIISSEKFIVDTAEGKDECEKRNSENATKTHIRPITVEKSDILILKNEAKEREKEEISVDSEHELDKNVESEKISVNTGDGFDRQEKPAIERNASQDSNETSVNVKQSTGKVLHRSSVKDLDDEESKKKSVQPAAFLENQICADRETDDKQENTSGEQIRAQKESLSIGEMVDSVNSNIDSKDEPRVEKEGIREDVEPVETNDQKICRPTGKNLGSDYSAKDSTDDKIDGEEKETSKDGIHIETTVKKSSNSTRKMLGSVACTKDLIYETEKGEEEKEEEISADKETTETSSMKGIKSTRNTSRFSPSAKNFIDNEAEEGEEEESSAHEEPTEIYPMKGNKSTIKICDTAYSAKDFIDDEAEEGEEEISSADETDSAYTAKDVIDDEAEEGEEEISSADETENYSMEGSKSNRKLSGKDFIDDEAEEGEEEISSADESENYSMKGSKSNRKLSGSAYTAKDFIDDEAEEGEEEESSANEEPTETGAIKVNKSNRKLSGSLHSTKDFIDDEAEEGEEEESSADEEPTVTSAMKVNKSNRKLSGSLHSTKDFIDDEAEEWEEEESSADEEPAETSAMKVNKSTRKLSSSVHSTKDFIDDEAEEGEEEESSADKEPAETSIMRVNKSNRKLSGSVHSTKDFTDDEAEEGEEEESSADEEFAETSIMKVNKSNRKLLGSVHSTKDFIDDEAEDRENRESSADEEPAEASIVKVNRNKSNRKMSGSICSTKDFIDDEAEEEEEERSSADEEPTETCTMKVNKSNRKLSGSAYSAKDFIDDADVWDDELNADYISEQKGPIKIKKMSTEFPSAEDFIEDETTEGQDEKVIEEKATTKVKKIKRHTMSAENCEVISKYSCDEDDVTVKKPINTFKKRVDIQKSKPFFIDSSDNVESLVEFAENNLEQCLQDNIGNQWSVSAIPTSKKKKKASKKCAAKEKENVQGKSLESISTVSFDTSESGEEFVQKNVKQCLHDTSRNQWSVKVVPHSKKKQNTSKKEKKNPTKENIPLKSNFENKQKIESSRSNKVGGTEATKFIPLPKIDTNNFLESILFSSNSETGKSRKDKSLKSANNIRANFPSQEALACSNAFSVPPIMAKIFNLKSITARELRNVLFKHEIKEIESIHLDECPSSLFSKGKGFGTVVFSTEKELMHAVDLRPQIFWQGLTLRMEADPSFKPVTRAAKEWMYKNIRTASNFKTDQFNKKPSKC